MFLVLKKKKFRCRDLNIKKIFIALTIIIYISSICHAIVPNADISSDESLNISYSMTLGSGYDANIKLGNRLAVGYKYFYISFFSWQRMSSVYCKYLLAEDSSTGTCWGLYASSFQSNGGSGGWSGSTTTYNFSGYNFGPLLVLKLDDNLVFRAAYALHSIQSSYRSNTSRSIPYYFVDPNGLEFAWTITPNLEFALGYSTFGIIGLKAKI